jgi:hypothetical protein
LNLKFFLIISDITHDVYGSLSKKSLDFSDNLAEGEVVTSPPGSLTIFPEGKLLSSSSSFACETSLLHVILLSNTYLQYSYNVCISVNAYAPVLAF